MKSLLVFLPKLLIRVERERELDANRANPTLYHGPTLSVDQALKYPHVAGARGRFHCEQMGMRTHQCVRILTKSPKCID